MPKSLIVVETRGVGASGSLLSMVVVYACMMPKAMLTVFPVPVPMQASVAIGTFAAGSVFCALSGLLPFIGHVGHLGGMAFGVGWYYAMGRRLLASLRFR